MAMFCGLFWRITEATNESNLVLSSLQMSITVAWQWLKQATTAKQQLLTENPQGDMLAFYESKIHTMKFFYAYEVPKTAGLFHRLLDDEVLTIAGEKELVM